MVAGEEDRRVLEDALSRERFHDPAETVIDREQHLEPAPDLVVFRRRFGTKRWQSIDRAKERGFSHGRLEGARPPRHCAAQVTVTVPLGGHESSGLSRQRHHGSVVTLDHVRMNRFVRQVREEWPLPGILDEPFDVIGEQIGRIAGSAHAPAVDVQRRIDGLPLSRHPHPMIETGTRTVIVAHVPLAEERRAIAGALQRRGEDGKAIAAPRGVVDDAVRMRVLARQETGAAGGAERRRRKRVCESDSLAGQPIDLRRFDERVTGGAEIVPPHVVDEHHHDVRSS